MEYTSDSTHRAWLYSQQQSLGIRRKLRRRTAKQNLPTAMTITCHTQLTSHIFSTAHK